ncbi:hotdog domain-containing protein [Tissierella sp. Yu-01]|uniref:acyl-CoA thioesterase n=1 Tax=Tissierella sp. Yu-01 TaxID=3035694 RepID=UPI00240D8CA5|nr:hotdog domain-containing protein [Tissierella sp. Yu-01]WFA08666.1 hotdog domain-containing protein [Tissierella sp. Yu-01]
MEKVKVSRLVKPQELNHHGTLFAGRMAEWFVENSFICAAKATGRPENIVCVNIHGLTFKTPANNGDIVDIESMVARVGRTSFTTYGRISKNGLETCEGYITFTFVDENNKPIPHNLVLDETDDPIELEIRRKALELSKK